MLLALNFFSINDVFLFPLCVLILFAIIRNKAEDPKNVAYKKIYYRGFFYKVFFVLAYTTVTEFIFKGGDTRLYYQGVHDLRAALDDNFDHISTVINSKSIDLQNPLAPYFYYDNYTEDFTFNYMRNVSNFFVPRLGLLPSLIFFNSYLCISMIFGFFALGGSIRIFKFFHYYFPSYKKELALAAVFIPSVCFWSSGFLKDTICFGAIGYILYGTLNIFVRKRHVFASFILLLISGMLIYYIKVYILLAFILAMTIWLFAETNKLIKDTTLRTIFSLLTLIFSIGVAYLLLSYFTSQEAAQTFKLDTLMEKSEQHRHSIESVQQEGGSGFTLNTSNPLSLVFGSISATFFRPFPWEINTPIALFSAIESLVFLILTLNFFFKRGVKTYFRNIFSDPKLLMCFVFAIVFGIAVGASTTNFGALSRYKIPCMPFYFIMLLLVYKKSELRYPKWFGGILKRTI
ncbi:MAG TPA: hypothetical protein PKC72_09715 [Chitinophagaceae bacterium]|nr:hypothetical protein [Chitinophagaceae bacterium]